MKMLSTYDQTTNLQILFSPIFFTDIQTYPALQIGFFYLSSWLNTFWWFWYKIGCLTIESGVL